MYENEFTVFQIMSPPLRVAYPIAKIFGDRTSNAGKKLLWKSPSCKYFIRTLIRLRKRLTVSVFSLQYFNLLGRDHSLLKNLGFLNHYRHRYLSLNFALPSFWPLSKLELPGFSELENLGLGLIFETRNPGSFWG